MTAINTSELDDLIVELLPYRYPDYNLGLLPDEEGYDEVQARDHYLTDEARAEAKARLQALIARELITELELVLTSGDNGGMVSEDGIKDRITELNTSIPQAEGEGSGK